VSFRRHGDFSDVPTGTVSMENQSVQITPSSGAPEEIPVGQIQNLIDLPTFERSLQRPGIFEAWKGSASFGASLVLATQNNRTYTSAVSLVRAVPTESWMDPVSRTTLDFSSSYGELVQPGQPTVKTSIYHADAERDQYFTKRVYAFAQGAFDHNYSQGLDLEQTVGGGFGWTVVKTPKESLDLKSALTYEKEQFFQSSGNQNLLAAVVSETFDRTFSHGVALHQLLSVAPAISNPNAYSATGSVNLAINVYKQLAISLGSLDTFLNNPSPGYKKNSFQFTTSLTYTIK
jgi:hypothetical protein